MVPRGTKSPGDLVPRGTKSPGSVFVAVYLSLRFEQCINDLNSICHTCMHTYIDTYIDAIAYIHAHTV